MTKKKHYAIVPCEGTANLCEFDGTFDEGEGFSMGHPIRWKYPNNATPIQKICSLATYDDDPFAVASGIVAVHPEIKEIYLEGISDSGWYSREDLEV